MNSNWTIFLCNNTIIQIMFLGISQPVWDLYAFYGTLAALKLSLMFIFTVRARLANNVPSSVANSPAVERTRRAHLNDMENIIPFLFLAFIFITTNPNPIVAKWHFRMFVVSRCVHTFCYLMGLPRFSFIVGVLINISLGVQSLMYYIVA